MTRKFVSHVSFNEDINRFLKVDINPHWLGVELRNKKRLRVVLSGQNKTTPNQPKFNNLLPLFIIQTTNHKNKTKTKSAFIVDCRSVNHSQTAHNQIKIKENYYLKITITL